MTGIENEEIFKGLIKKGKTLGQSLEGTGAIRKTLFA